MSRHLWQSAGMKQALAGIFLEKPKRTSHSKALLTPEDIEIIQGKSKTEDKKNVDKKAPKKDEPKKKKDEARIEYKPEPLSTYETFNLSEPMNRSFSTY